LLDQVCSWLVAQLLPSTRIHYSAFIKFETGTENVDDLKLKCGGEKEFGY